MFRKKVEKYRFECGYIYAPSSNRKRTPVIKYSKDELDNAALWFKFFEGKFLDEPYLYDNETGVLSVTKEKVFKYLNELFGTKIPRIGGLTGF
jgi:hypothetical protein